MSEHFTYIPKGVCSRQMDFDLNEGKIEKVVVTGGCNGKIYKLNEDKKNTHFGRMDLKIKEQELTESMIMYIGEKSITDDNHKIIVYDWRSPVANLFYMANQTDFKYDNRSIYAMMNANTIVLR